jgi:excisionase family DNA binding protein
MTINNGADKAGIKDSAYFLGVSPHTLRAWTRERRIPFHRCGRRIVFAVADLERFLADNRVRRARNER